MFGESLHNINVYGFSETKLCIAIWDQGLVTSKDGSFSKNLSYFCEYFYSPSIETVLQKIHKKRSFNFQPICKLLCKSVHLFCMQNRFAGSISVCKCSTSQLAGKSRKILDF